MNINDLPQDSYTPINPNNSSSNTQGVKPLNINDLPPNSYTPVTNTNQSQGDNSDKSSGSSSGLMTGPLSLLATPGQLAGKYLLQKGGFGFGQGIEKSGSNIESNIVTLKRVSDQFLALASKETDPIKKSQDIQHARDATNDMNKASQSLTDIYGSLSQKTETPIGDIPAISNNPLRAGEQILGRGAQTVALTTPVLGATGSGAMLGLGRGLEEGASPSDIALQTGEYALGGKIAGFAGDKLLSTGIAQRMINSPTGKIIGEGLGALVSSPAEKGTIGASVDTGFKKFGELADKTLSPSIYYNAIKNNIVKPLGESVGVFRNSKEQLINAQSKIEQYWNETKQRYGAAIKYDSNSPRILGQEGIIPQGGKGGAMITSDQEVLLRAKIGGEHNTLNDLLDSTGNYGSLDQAKREAVKFVEQNFQGQERIAAKIHLEKQFEALVRDNSEKIVTNVNGERVMKLRDLNNMKSYLWSQGYTSKLAPNSERIIARTSRLMGNALKSTIENSADSIGDQTTKNAIISLNKRLGDLSEAADFLHEMNGKKLAIGTMAKYFARSAGVIAGGIAGGIPGEFAGYMTADKLVDVFQNPKFSVGKAANIIAFAKKEAPEALAEAEKIIQENMVKRASRLSLPTGSTIPLGAQIPRDPFLFSSKDAGIINSINNQADMSARMLPKPSFTTGNQWKGGESRLIPSSQIESPILQRYDGSTKTSPSLDFRTPQNNQTSLIPKEQGSRKMTDIQFMKSVIPKKK